MRLDSLAARAIPDTRGRPTVEVTLTAGAHTATASVPSGKSTGSHEAKELRDADGGVAGALANLEGEIASAVVGRDFASADELDHFLIKLDGTPDKSRLGANTLLAVSIAAARLDAQRTGVPLWKSIAARALTTPAAPRLFLNFMNGGVHADFKLPFQEYILVVAGMTSAALPVASDAFAKLGEKLGDVAMGDEGGYAPAFTTLEKPFELLTELTEAFPHTSLAIDAAASEFYADGAYTLLGKKYSASELAGVYRSLVAHHPLHSIEDPFFEDAASDFVTLTAALGSTVLVVGDDFTTTNPTRIEAARAANAITAVLIKPNQIGTVAEAINAVQMTQANGWAAICSHRSGETDDTFIADFAYGVGAYGIKAGGLGQRERLEKYERLLAIEGEV